MGNFTVFVVEDDEWYNKLITHTIGLNPDLNVKSFKTGNECIKALSQAPDIITIDYRLPDMTGEELLKEVLSRNPNITVIIISEQNDIEIAVGLLKEGAYDYLVKSNEIRERLLNCLGHIIKNKSLENEVRELKREVKDKYELSKNIIGKSDPIKKVFNLAERALDNNITISITGETGTGKENLAKSIHFNSVQSKGPFVAVNVAAIPETLVESELFGHEKGAFTGAQMKRIGKFEEADGGTLFLDEIAEMDMSIQVKLLRALQEKEVTRVGSNKTIPFNCRIIVATHKNLKELVEKGEFREDLFYRLLGLVIELPPLRERGGDILLLADHFISLFAKENNLPVKKLSEESKNELLKYHWPGNIRELKSVIELASILSDEDVIYPDHIKFSSSNNLEELLVTELTLREYTRKIVKFFMKKYNDNTKLVSEKLDIGQTTVYRVLKEIDESN